MDVNTIITIWPILTAVFFLVMGWLLWHLSKRFVQRQEHEALQGEVVKLQTCVDGVGTQLAALQSRLEHLPAAGEVNKILLGLEEVRGTQRELMATFKGQGEVLKRIEHPVQLLMAAHMDGGNHK